MRERFGASNARSMLCRFHVQTAGSSLTAQSIDNNVVRTTIEALSAVLGGAQSLHTNSRDEALALPTEEAARLALRTQQIIAYEAGVTETPDPLAGSYYVESLTNELEAAAWAYLDEIESMGGTLAAIERGFQQREIQEAAYRVQQAIESGDQVVVGVNRFRDDEVHTPPIQRIDPDGERRQVERVQRVRAERVPSGGRPRWTSSRGSPRGRQPHAGHPRRGPRARHGRRDQRPPPRGLGRASRADHGLTPSGRRQCGCQRSSVDSTSTSIVATRRTNGSARAASAAMRSNGASSVSDSVTVRCGTTTSKAPPYGGKPGNAATTAAVSVSNGTGGSGTR